MVREISTSENFGEIKKPWSLTSEEVDFFQQIAEERASEGRPQTLWGWKRDRVIEGRRYPESRTVYFSADLILDPLRSLSIGRAFLFLDTRAPDEEIGYLSRQVGESRELGIYPLTVWSWREREYPGYSRLRLEIGEPTAYDRQTVARRLKGKPRLSIEPPRLIPESQDYDLSEYAPFAAYLGSGLSAESGLPLLGSIHNLFEVDNPLTGELIFGAQDSLPRRLVTNVEEELKKFCQFTVGTISARPSESHSIIANLFQKEVLRQVFTDNMDDLLKKANVPFTQTRLSIFPDRFPVELDEGVKALLVVGVAVDRREVIKQVRGRGKKIIVINPVLEVAPHSRNMDYLRPGDIFFRETTGKTLPKIVLASGF